MEYFIHAIYIWNKAHAILLTSHIFGTKHLPTVGCKYKKHKLCLGRGGRTATDASRAFSIQLDSTGPLKEHCDQCNKKHCNQCNPREHCNQCNLKEHNNQCNQTQKSTAINAIKGSSKFFPNSD